MRKTRGPWVLSTAFLMLAALPPAGFGASAEMNMWSCAQMGQRRPVLYLADRGSRSYIKFQGQRIPATHQVDDAGHQWKFGGNAVTAQAGHDLEEARELTNMGPRFHPTVRW